MPFKAILFVFGVTEQYRVDVFQMVIAVWCFSVGYLLYKRASRALSQQRFKTAMHASPGELSCLTAESYRAL